MHRDRGALIRLRVISLRAVSLGCVVGTAVLSSSCGVEPKAVSADASDSWDDAERGANNNRGGDYQPRCTEESCGSGFHCEFDACVPDTPPAAPHGATGRDPIASSRYVFSLEVQSRRLVRIDSLTLEVAAFAAGLGPMDLAVVGSREITVLLDAMNLVEVLDHRQERPLTAAWETARSLSHVVVSPTGQHAVAYYDWDDMRAQERQPEPGNINQVSVLYIGDDDSGFTDDQARIANVAVGFLPRDVRFSTDGTRAVVISRDTLTPITLGTTFGAVAMPEAPLTFDGKASKILVNPEATRAVARYPGEERVDVIDLSSAAVTCLVASLPATDIALARDGRLLISAGDGEIQGVTLLSLDDAASDPCTTVTTQMDVNGATRLAADQNSDLAIAYEPAVGYEDAWRLDLQTLEVAQLRLEKAVAAVAFAGDGRYALISHLKASGTPAWDPSVEDPDVSVDKSHGVTWLDLEGGGHRLAVSDEPLGPFVFVPASAERDGATFQAVLNERQPQLLRVSHQPGFNDAWVDLAALPLQMGFLSATEKTYVTQDHPWGRVTFVDTQGVQLRHVTGFALEVE